VSAAGHITAGDTPQRTIIREAKEELGLDLDPADLTFIGIKKVDEAMPDETVHRVFNWTYLAQMNIDIEDIKLEEAEVSNIRWLPVDEFEAELNDPIKQKHYTPTRLEFYREVIEEVHKRSGENDG
jgi:isopentenyl-diphosphate Delta-isomerase